jgi:hypothetical protein
MHEKLDPPKGEKNYKDRPRWLLIVIISLVAAMYIIDILRKQGTTYIEIYQHMIDILKK